MLCLALASLVLADEQTPEQLYSQGRMAERNGHMAEAYLLYSEAAAMDPDNTAYWLRSQAVRSRAALEAKPAPPPTANGIPGTPRLALQERFGPPTPEDLADSRRPLPPSELRAPEVTKDFDLRGNAQTLFETVAKTFELDCVFDSDYQPGNPIRFQLKDVGYRVALRALEVATGSFIVPISGKLFLVAKDTPQKRVEVEPSVAVAVPLPEPTTAQDFTALVTAVQQTMALEKVSFDTQNNTVIIRDRISKVLPARAMLEQMMNAKSQVMIEMRFLEVSRNDMITYGINFPDLFPLVPLTNWMNNQPSLSKITNLLTFGGGKTLMGLGFIDPSLVATLSQSSGNTLLDTQVRSVEGVAATVHVGERYPILTAGYFGPSNFTRGGTVYTPPPSFTFEDLGLTVKITSVAHGSDQLGMDLEAEFKVLTGQSVNGIPVVANRALHSAGELKMGDWAVIGGLINDTEARTIAGLAGLARIPGLGPLTSTHHKDSTTDRVLILVRPTLLGPPPSETVVRSFLLGSETRPLSPL